MTAPRIRLRRLVRVLDLALDLSVGGLLAVIVVVTLAQVVARYVLGASLVWSVELIGLFYVWLVMLAAAKVRHMRITLITDLLPKPARRLVDWLVAAVSLACLGLLFYGGASIWLLLRNDSYARLPLSPGLLFLAVCVGSAIWAVVILSRLAAGQDGGPVGDRGDSVSAAKPRP